jgi:5-methylcytosine-specific restriction endonuclease McrA
MVGSVLLLNATFEPVSVISLQRAIILLLKEKAEVIEAAETRFRSERMSLPVPVVIRLVYFVRIPNRLSIPISRRTVLARDNYTCQYCGSQPARSELTVDHVFPRSRGGKQSWDNVVTACKRCNTRKGSRSLQEAGLILRSRPEKPRFLALVLFSSANDESRLRWRKYLAYTLSEQAVI